jgi:hypothetical protein
MTMALMVGSLGSAPAACTCRRSADQRGPPGSARSPLRTGAGPPPRPPAGGARRRGASSAPAGGGAWASASSACCTSSGRWGRARPAPPPNRVSGVPPAWALGGALRFRGLLVVGAPPPPLPPRLRCRLPNRRPMLMSAALLMPPASCVSVPLAAATTHRWLRRSSTGHGAGVSCCERGACQPAAQRHVAAAVPADGGRATPRRALQPAAVTCDTRGAIQRCTTFTQ